MRLAFEFDALHELLARLHEEDRVDRVRRAGVLHVVAEERQGRKTPSASRFVLGAELELASGLRLERIALTVQPGGGQEGGGVAGIGRYAVVEDIGQAGAAGDLRVGRDRGCVRDAVIGRDPRIVVAQAQRSDGPPEADLVLGIQAHLAHILEGRRRVGRGLGDDPVVDGVKNVQRRDAD
ncbi:hypothetical protein D3C71_1449830 [compost metagenome]